MGRYLDHCANLERRVARRNVVLIVLLIMLFVQVWAFGRQDRPPQPISVVPTKTAPGIYGEGALLSDVARHFAESYVLALGNFTPETARKVYHNSLTYLSPAALAVARTGLEEELRRIEHSKISSQFTVDGEVEVQKRDGLLLVVVPGQKRVFAGREIISDKPTAYHLAVSQVPATTANLYGLQIEELTQEVEVKAVTKGDRS